MAKSIRAQCMGAQAIVQGFCPIVYGIVNSKVVIERLALKPYCNTSLDSSKVYNFQ